MERAFARKIERRPQPQENDSTEQEIELTDAEYVGQTVPVEVTGHYNKVAKRVDNRSAEEASLREHMRNERTGGNRMDAELIAVKERIVQELMDKDAFIQSATPRMEALADVAALTFREAQQQGKAQEKKEYNLLKEKYVARVKAIRNDAKKDPRYIEEKKRLEKLRNQYANFHVPEEQLTELELDKEDAEQAPEEKAARAA